jgi:hypothetical protein
MPKKMHQTSHHDLDNHVVDNHVVDNYGVENHGIAAFFKASRGDSLIRFNISRNTLIAIICSLIIHALIFFAVPKISLDTASAPPPQTIEVSLAPPAPVQKPQVLPAESPKLEKPKKSVAKPTPKVIAQKPEARSKPVFSVPDVPVIPKSSPELVPLKDSKDAPTDMMSYVKARQAQRQATESDAAKQNAEAAAKEHGPTEAQIRDEKIKRNLQSGTNGIFEVTTLSGRHAGFSFRGWTNDYSSSKRQFFEVEAGSGQDIRLVMIKKMIGLIREHYQGDFNWDSNRLARLVILSARPEDNAGLEEFMMTEFFGSNYKNTQ